MRLACVLRMTGQEMGHDTFARRLSRMHFHFIAVPHQTHSASRLLSMPVNWQRDLQICVGSDA